MSKKKTILLGVVLLLVVVAIVQGVAVIRHGFSARDNPSWIETVMARSARRMAAPARAKQMTNPIPKTAENLAEAEAHWADHCATCHANNGSGDTEIGKNLYPRAPDMRLPATQNLSEGELYYTIQNGIRLTGMPAWGETGDNDEDTWKLVHFIRHLPRLTPEEEKDMERLNPKGPEERKEEQEEQEFLNQSPAPAAQPHHKKH
jgi:mono/diheme cytochrome c family protein